MSEQPQLVLRWYTRARRIPRMVGKLPGSERGIPGGPYTLTQISGAAVTFWVLSKVSPALVGDGLIANLAVQVIPAVVVLFALRLVKPGGRDPVSSGIAACAVMTSSRWGRHGGRSLKPKKPVRVHATVRVRLPAPQELCPTVPAHEPVLAVAPVSPPVLQPSADPAAPTPAGPVPVTALERLLALKGT